MKPKKTYFRADVAKGLEDPIIVDRDENVIRGFSVITKGMARGHGFEIDDTTLEQIEEQGNAHKLGIKSRYGHPNMSSTAMGTLLGRVRSFRRDGDRTRADLHMDQAAFTSPKGDLATYVMNLAESDPAAFGASIVFECERAMRLNEDGTPKKDKDGKELPPLARCKELIAADVVDEPAANDQGMFGDMFTEAVCLSAEMSERLESYLDEPDAIPNVLDFLHRFEKNAKNDGQRKNIAALIAAVEHIKDGTEPTKQSTKPSTEGKKMPEPEKKKDGLQPDAQTAAHLREVEEAKEAAKLAATTAERDRGAAIRELGIAMNIPAEKVTEFIAGDKDATAVAREMATINASQKTSVPNTPVSVTADERDKMHAGMVEAFSVKSGLTKDPKVLESNRGSKYRGATLQSCAVECLRVAGVDAPHLLTGDQLYAQMIRRAQLSHRAALDGHMAQTTGDFTSILSNVLNKSLAKGWEEAGTTYQLWTGTGNLSDFKQADIAKGTAYSDVEEIPEGEAPRHGSFNDAKEVTRLKTFGSYYTLTRQALVNDDMNWFSRTPRKMTGSMRRYVNWRVYNYLYNALGTAAVNFTGPTMLEDGLTLFEAATHTNYLALGAGGAVGEAPVAVGWNAMVNQTLPSPDGGISNVIRANVKPRYLICGPANTMAAHKLFASLFYSTGATDEVGGYQTSNIFGPGQPRNLQVVEEPILDAFITAVATYPWYLASDPNIMETLTVYFLNGQDTPVTDSEPSSIGEAEGMKWQVRMDFEVNADDWRGMYLNTGR